MKRKTKRPGEVAFVFPGQGAQYVGMGMDLYEKYDEVKEIYEEAKNSLGYDLGKLSFYGPKEELNKTFRTQPCLVTASIAAYKVLEINRIRPSIVAGHSLGEYTALVAAGVLSLKDALVLTERRGMFMQEAVPEGRGMMAAILGLEREKVDEVCLSITSGYVSPANYNSPGQIVIAGEKKAVEEAIRLSREADAKRAVPLAVSVPSHCTLMVSASEKLSQFFENMTFHEPTIPIVNNADAILLSNIDGIKASLIRQLNSPLLWEDSIKTIISTGINTFVEVGPGKVLSGLIKRIDSEVDIYNVQDSKSLEHTIEALSSTLI